MPNKRFISKPINFLLSPRKFLKCQPRIIYPSIPDLKYQPPTFSFTTGIFWITISRGVGLKFLIFLTKVNFIGVPLTSKQHIGSWYVNFEFNYKKQCAVVAQVENISAYRLHYKIGELPESDLDKVIDGLYNLLRKNKP